MTAAPPDKIRYRYIGEVAVMERVTVRDHWRNRHAKYAVLKVAGPDLRPWEVSLALIPLGEATPSRVPPCSLIAGEHRSHSYARWVGLGPHRTPIWSCRCGRLKHTPGRIPMKPTEN